VARSCELWEEDRTCQPAAGRTLGLHAWEKVG
jgi:hypothetical protein